ncbi:MAG: CHAT domain-containing protein [Aquimonas sp.]|nr:CHAT domain-containing protein [Aquimonas sp.]
MPLRCPGRGLMDARLLLLVLMAMDAGAAAASAWSCDGADPATARLLDVPLRLQLAPGPASAAVLVLEERGASLGWALDDQPVAPFGSRPPRLALQALRIERPSLLRVEAQRAGDVAQVQVQLHCRPDPGLQALPACIAEAAARAAGPLDARAELNGELADSSPLCAAVLAHAQAQALSRAGSNQAGIEAHAEVAERWQALQHPTRALAAEVGRLALLQRAGRLEDAVQAAAGVAAQSQALVEPAGAYYRARAEGVRCNALFRLGRQAEARACATPLPERFEALAEASEAANAWFNLAAMAADEGREGEARTALDRAASPGASPLVRARVAQLRSGLLADAGDINAALAEASAALAHFEAAGETRWQANVYLRLAEFKLGLGAHAEASAYVDAALERLPSAEAPERLAAALLLRARVRAAAGQPGALDDAEAAAAVFTAGSQPLSALRAGLLAQRIAPDSRRLRRLVGAAAELELSPRVQRELELAQARAALELDALDEAGRLLDSEDDSGSLSQYLEARLLRARLLLRAGEGQAALSLIEGDIARVRSLAESAGGSGLRHLAARRLLPLRAAWVDTWGELDPAQRPSDLHVLGVLLDTHVDRLLRSSVTESQTLTTPRALAGALLRDEDGIGEAELLAQRALLAQMLGQRAPPAAARRDDLQAALHRLGPEQRVLAHGFGERHALVLMAGPERVQTQMLGAAAPLRQWVRALREALASTALPLDEVEARAAAASALLPSRELPAHPDLQLLVLADPELSGLPLALLRWPGEARPLLERARLSWVDGLPEQPSALRAGANVHALIAGDAGQPGLPLLQSVAAEPGLIEQGLGRALGSVEPAQRARLRQRLADPEAWVHVAAHGSTRAGVQGFSGLWLQAGAETDDAAGFLNWLELAAWPVAAPLVVLNACALAEAGTADAGASASFASALSAAGSDHVVAALWPVSDAASALWVERFYARLAEAHDPAAALQAAQQRLRESRSFRHPHHWAALVHLQR